MRPGLILLIVLFAIFGAVFGALNAERISLDLYFSSFELPKGAALLAALLLGWLAGGLAIYFGVALRLKRQLRALKRQAGNCADPAIADGQATNGNPDTPLNA